MLSAQARITKSELTSFPTGNDRFLLLTFYFPHPTLDLNP